MMAAYYKTIIRYQHIDYDLVQNRVNSRHYHILAIDRKTFEESQVARIDNKTGNIEWYKEDLPEKVKTAIEGLTK